MPLGFSGEQCHARTVEPISDSRESFMVAMALRTALFSNGPHFKRRSRNCFCCPLRWRSSSSRISISKYYQSTRSASAISDRKLWAFPRFVHCTLLNKFPLLYVHQPFRSSMDVVFLPWCHFLFRRPIDFFRNTTWSFRHKSFVYYGGILSLVSKSKWTHGPASQH